LKEKRLSFHHTLCRIHWLGYFDHSWLVLISTGDTVTTRIDLGEMVG
jgi:hypothetical protein